MAKLFKDPKAGLSIFSRSAAATTVGEWALKLYIDNLGSSANFNITN